MNLFFDIERFQGSKEDYIRKAKSNALVTGAVLENNNWHEPEIKSWYVLLNDEKWTRKCNDLIDRAPDDVLLSVYTCHF